MCCVAKTGADARLGTHVPASRGHLRCREIAIYVHDPGYCEPPDGRPGNSGVPGCGRRSQAVRGSLADRTTEGKKRLCRVTLRSVTSGF